MDGIEFVCKMCSCTLRQRVGKVNCNRHEIIKSLTHQARTNESSFECDTGGEQTPCNPVSECNTMRQCRRECFKHQHKLTINKWSKERCDGWIRLVANQIITRRTLSIYAENVASCAQHMTLYCHNSWNS